MSNQEVKVGQVWRNKKYGADYFVVYRDETEVALSGKDAGVFRLDISPQFFERFSLFRESLSHDNDYDYTDTTSLRDHFAGLAMQGLVAEHSNHSDSLIANKAYHIADAMLKARGE